MNNDHKLGFPPAVNAVELELEDDWGLNDPEPYPFGTPQRVREEYAQPCKAEQAHFAKLVNVAVFNKGNHALPDGSFVRSKLDDERDEQAAQRGVQVGRQANLQGQREGTPGLMLPVGEGIQTISVNLRIARDQAKALNDIITNDPKAMARLIEHMQDEALDYLGHLGIGARPLTKPVPVHAKPAAPPMYVLTKEPHEVRTITNGLASLLQDQQGLAQKVAQSNKEILQSKQGLAALFKA